MFVATGWRTAIVFAGVSLLMLMPIGGALKAEGTRAEKPLASIAAALAAVGAGGVALTAVGATAAAPLLVLFLIGAIFYGWIANYFIIKYQ